MTCPDCKGTGEYQGLQQVEACGRCQGRGQVDERVNINIAQHDELGSESVTWGPQDGPKFKVETKPPRRIILTNGQGPQFEEWKPTIWEGVEVVHPLVFKAEYWPQVRFYDRQEEIALSVEYNVVTLDPAGNKLGKDYGGGYIGLSNFIRFCSAGIDSRIISTSNTDDHLRVLWSEIGYFLSCCKYPLKVEDGGPLVVNHRDIRWRWPRGFIERHDSPKDRERLRMVEEKSYLHGLVAEREEKMAGHHATYTLAIGDEATGLQDFVHRAFQGWAKRFLYFGNPNGQQADSFFGRMCDEGDKQ